MLDIDAYLDRIHYEGPRTPTPATLRSVHRAHMLSVPFENLDIMRKHPISIVAEDSVRKIVNQGRGGFCYELNGAFAALLDSLGFKVDLLSARPARQAGDFAPEFDHLALRVEAAGQPWLADVGFGDLFLEPLKLETGIEQPQGIRSFRIVNHGGDLLLAMRDGSQEWKNQYRFSLHPRRIEEFAERSRFHQTSPESHFTRNSVCSLATADGRVTLSGSKLIITTGGKREERIFAASSEVDEALREKFGIVLAP